jgi:hypothetical protein
MGRCILRFFSKICCVMDGVRQGFYYSFSLLSLAHFSFVNYNNRPPSAVSFMPAIASTSGRLHSEFVRLLFLQTHRETDRFFAGSGVQSVDSTSDQFHFRRTAFSSGIKSKVVLALAKTSSFRINLNLDGSPIASKSHTHPTHSQTSRLFTSSLSLGVPVPRPTQCVRVA